METDWTESIRDILQALAMPSKAQIEITHPACPTCDLTDDYELYARLYREQETTLVSDRADGLKALDAQFAAMDDAHFECWNNEALDLDGWEKVRKLARTALEAFGLPITRPEPYVEVEPGVWKRSSNTIVSSSE
jgi:hypothetical protein